MIGESEQGHSVDCKKHAPTDDKSVSLRPIMV